MKLLILFGVLCFLFGGLEVWMFGSLDVIRLNPKIETSKPINLKLLILFGVICFLFGGLEVVRLLGC